MTGFHVGVAHAAFPIGGRHPRVDGADQQHEGCFFHEALTASRPAEFPALVPREGRNQGVLATAVAVDSGAKLRHQAHQRMDLERVEGPGRGCRAIAASVGDPWAAQSSWESSARKSADWANDRTERRVRRACSTATSPVNSGWGSLTIAGVGMEVVTSGNFQPFPPAVMIR
jgi:hypothetical protein